MSPRKNLFDQLDEAIDDYLSGSQSPDINVKLSALAKEIPSPPTSSPRTPPTSTIPAGRNFFPNRQYNSPPSPPSSTFSYSPRSSPPAMPRNTTSNAPIKVEKSRTVKRNYQRRKQGFQFSTQQLRQIERNEELKRRADKIKGKERRAKENKSKKDEKERKAREERQRLGLPELSVKPDPAQFRLTQLFRGRKKVAAEPACPPTTPFEVVQIFEDPEAEDDCGMSEVAEPAGQITLPIRSLTSTPQIQQNATQENTTAAYVDLGLPEDWEVYIDSDAEIEQELAKDGARNSIPSSNSLPPVSKAGGSSTSGRKILAPKRPTTRLNISREQLADEIIAMISTQDLTSDKENLDSTQPSPGEKAPDYTPTINKSTHRNDDIVFDGDDESLKGKQLKRTLLKSLLKPEVEAASPQEEPTWSPIYDIGLSYSELDKIQVREEIADLDLGSLHSSSPDEYGFKDLDGFEDELAAEMDLAEAETKLMALVNGTLSQGWCYNFMMGTQELRDIGLKA